MHLFRKLVYCCLLLVAPVGSWCNELTYLNVYQQDGTAVQVFLDEQVVLRFLQDNLQVNEKLEMTHNIAIDDIQKITFDTEEINASFEAVSMEKKHSVQKIFENGTIIIIKDGVRYNILGVHL